MSKPPYAGRLRALLLGAAAVLAATDLILKATAEAQLTGGDTLDMGLLSLSLHYNTGVAFSLGASLHDWVIVAGTGLITFALGCYFIGAVPRLSWISRAGGTLVLAGALGNLLDRVEGNGVVDYLHTGWFPTFNLADVFITVGAIVFGVGALTHDHVAASETKDTN